MLDLSLHGKFLGIDLRTIEGDQALIDYGNAPIWLLQLRATLKSSAQQDTAYAGAHILAPAHAAKVKCDHELAQNMASRNKDESTFEDSGVTYSCKPGYSFTASDPTDTQRTVNCRSNRTLEAVSPSDCSGNVTET